MQEGRKCLHWEVFPWHPDSCHILLEAPGPPPPSQRPPTETHHPSYPAAFLLSTSNEACVWLMLSHLTDSPIFLSCCWKIAMRNSATNILPPGLWKPSWYLVFLQCMWLLFSDSPLPSSFSWALKYFPYPFYYSVTSFLVSGAIN